MMSQVPSHAHSWSKREVSPNQHHQRGTGDRPRQGNEKSEMESRHNESIIHYMHNTVCVDECVFNNPQIYETNIVLPAITNRYPSVNDYFCSPAI